MTLRRGFKAEAERRAVALRAELGLEPSDRLDINELAKHLGVDIVLADELIDIGRLEELERIQAFAFSACTFHIDGRHIIVINPLRVVSRQTSDIAHELAHILLGHELSEVLIVADTPFRTCRPDQEEEATALGGTLLLPRPLLLHAARKGYDIAAIARAYGVTEEMARYRYNTTGVNRQASPR
ncbi:ImmA/IrrE family metallo-endopeptidase [Catellatospora bangladeshensis]|uniref:IrrE N-terminal-like domain-containing protein n=1 Tax=Catellatospora bangladeshensis TaxID=310355 RepID=A0A8J3NKW9_9ACTN|nr:ImmA/IrrE family metallo-endopeptidase [Catellatospora bangladeshensis]GIF83141.1 hypothetical protein Cba03nite_44900 [Catellatospora bangladeshensis]